MRTVGASSQQIVSIQQRLSELLTLALQLHQTGRLDEAEAQYRAALALSPEQPDALHLMGVARYQRGDSAAAIEFIRRAVSARSNEATFHLHLGLAYRAAGDVAEAERSFRQTVRCQPNLVDGLINLGATLISQDRAGEAVAFLKRAVAGDPGSADAAANLGAGLLGIGQLDDALTALSRALALAPDHPDALANLGRALRERGDLRGARAAYERLAALQPLDACTLTRLGEITQLLGDLDAAVALYRRAIEADASYADAHNDLGAALGIQGDAESAIACVKRALELAPSYVEAITNRGSLELQRGHLDEAIGDFRRALTLRPAYAVAHSNLIFAMDLDDRVSAAEAFDERRRWNSVQSTGVSGASAWEVTADPERTLRVGYVSADFVRHSAAMTFAPVLLNHDPSRFEVYCYSGVQTEDELTERFRNAANGWYATVGVPDESLAGQIRRDRIDILVDLSGHSVGHRLGVFLRKPAPVQVTAWGYATGTGLDTMDYFLGDAVATPMELARYFSETIVHLPAIAVYSPPEGAPAPSDPPAYTNGYVTFGSFNRAQKLSDATIALWARVLRCVPDSRLMLKSQGLDQPTISGRLVEAFGRQGVERDRLILTGGTGRSEHLAAHGNVDIALDPIPHGGGVTALESLWMGVPSITAPGDRVQSRLAASFLTALDLCGFIAHNEDEFVELATTWAARLDELAEIRATLRERMAGSILCDGPAYCRAVEAAYRTMWRTWCERSTI